MQRSPPGYYLAFNIFMWGALLMAQAAAKNFGGLLALRILSGAFEAIADPAFMLITSMYYTRAEQPTRISAWYAFNGIGVAGGGLIGSLRGFSSQTFAVSNIYAQAMESVTSKEPYSRGGMSSSSWAHSVQLGVSFLCLSCPTRHGQSWGLHTTRNSS